ncbi:MAG: hypothetical protein ACTSYD_11205 [Candidatus Heimdallarchaeaceae archaeon]
MYSTIVFHANLQYAEISVDEIPSVISQSYIPVLQTLLDLPKVEVVLNFTGVTLDILYNQYPEVIQLIAEGIKKEKFELTACGYSHPIFPLLPLEDKKKQIEFHLNTLEKTLNYSPKGFWPPELAYDPTLPAVLKHFGISYLFFDDELYQISIPLKNDSNPYNRPYKSAAHYIINLFNSSGLFSKIKNYLTAMKHIKTLCLETNFRPVEVKGARGTITGIRIPQSWSIFTMASLSRQPFLTPKKIIKLVKKFRKHKGLIIPYGTDIEFIGYRNFSEGIRITPSILESFLIQLTKIEDNEMILPSKYLKLHKPKEISYMKTGSWAPDRRLDIWTRDEDNQMLERILREVRIYLMQLPSEQITDEIWHHILLAENSDGRGWDPLSERRLDCFSHALQALEMIKEKLLKK